MHSLPVTLKNNIINSLLYKFLESTPHLARPLKTACQWLHNTIFGHLLYGKWQHKRQLVDICWTFYTAIYLYHNTLHQDLDTSSCSRWFATNTAISPISIYSEGEINGKGDEINACNIRTNGIRKIHKSWLLLQTNNMKMIYFM